MLHRDLKPHNIMLGDYGEALIIDWGLAKATGRRDLASGSDAVTLVPLSCSDVQPTLAGHALGTPSYMSPEQASGDLAVLGPATDVYGLGAVLYQLLTGRAPVPGRDEVDVRERVLRGEITPPRAVNPRVPRPLEAVCLKALARQPEDRYATAKELRQDVERWLADEPVSAWREPWTSRARRWTKRHRTLVASTAAALFVAVAGLSVGLVLIDAARRREATANESANRRLDQTMEAIRDYYTGVSEEVLLGQSEFRALREKLLAKPLAFYEAMTARAGIRPAGRRAISVPARSRPIGPRADPVAPGTQRAGPATESGRDLRLRGPRRRTSRRPGVPG